MEGKMEQTKDKIEKIMILDTKWGKQIYRIPYIQGGGTYHDLVGEG